MNKTIKEIADELGIDKQKVYRYITKNCIKEALQDAQTKRYDEAAQKQIKQHFEEHKPHQKSASEPLYDALLKQLEVKDNQIAELQKLLDQEQKLNAVNQQKIALLEDKQKTKTHWWKTIFK